MNGDDVERAGIALHMLEEDSIAIGDPLTGEPGIDGVDPARIAEALHLISAGRLLSAAARGFGNPITGLLACVRGFRRAIDEERGEAYLTAMRDALDDLRDTSSALLDLANPRSGGWTNASWSGIVDTCVRLLAPEIARKELVLDTTRVGAASVHCLRPLLTHACWSVLANAVECSPRGGTVVVSPVRRGQLRGLQISDRGPGIPRAHLPRVCEPFFTTKPPGAGVGLGLTVAARALAEHDGTLAIEPSEGHGTAVFLLVPDFPSSQEAFG